ncbi:MAG: hypothetical protein P9L91_05070 [Candidatus Zophobacter franzmannii]|nr:hypothetical protein [Candidatus Zophobacter franzmannii]
MRVFLEERIAEIKLDLDKADIALRSFQTNSNTYQIDLQIESALDNYSQILLEKNKLDLEYLIQSQLLGESSPKVKILAMRDSLLTKQISDLEFSEDETGIYKSLNKVPQYTYEYRKLKRRQNVLELMYEYLIPIYETAKINEVKAVNSMELIDSPRLAGLRTKPKRTLLILFVSMMSLILANVYITIRESLISYGAINKQ